MKKVHAIFIGEIVLTLNAEYKNGMRSPEDMKSYFENGRLCDALKQLVERESDCKCEIYQKSAQLAFEEIKNNGSI